MFASILLAASLVGQSSDVPPSGGTYQPPARLVEIVAYDPMMGQMTHLPKQFHVDNPYPFRVCYPGPGTIPHVGVIAATRPWHFLPPAGWGIR